MRVAGGSADPGHQRGTARPQGAKCDIGSVEARHVIAFAFGFSVITFLHISAGEQAPKWLAIQKPLPVTLWIAYPMLWFHRASYPFVVALNWFSQWLLRQVGLQPAGEADLPDADAADEFGDTLQSWCHAIQSNIDR